MRSGQSVWNREGTSRGITSLPDSHDGLLARPASHDSEMNYGKCSSLQPWHEQSADSEWFAIVPGSLPPAAPYRIADAAPLARLGIFSLHS
jgi:hypothetical protein